MQKKSSFFKKFLAIFSILVILPILAGCKETEQKYNPCFNAKVLEVSEGYVLVEPLEGEEILKSTDQICVSTDVVSKIEVPQMEAGTQIRVVYNGDIAESYPAQINTVFAIYLLDENGEAILR